MQKIKLNPDPLRVDFQENAAQWVLTLTLGYS